MGESADLFLAGPPGKITGWRDVLAVCTFGIAADGRVLSPKTALFSPIREIADPWYSRRLLCGCQITGGEVQPEGGGRRRQLVA